MQIQHLRSPCQSSFSKLGAAYVAAVSSRSAVFLAVCYDDSSARHIPAAAPQSLSQQ